MIVTVNTTMVSIAFLFVAMRIFTRLKLTKMGVDDVLICFGWVFSFGVSLFIMLGTRYGAGRHSWDIPPEWPKLPKFGYIYVALYNPTLMMTKTSILTFYINKLGVKEGFRKICWVMMGYVICSSTAIFLTLIFQCKPLAGGWNRDLPGRKCISTTPLYYFSGANNLVTDVILLFLPMPIIWKLRLPLRQRLSLVVVFAMGAFIIRLHTVTIAVTSTDLPWTGAVSSTWSAVELNVAIICACMPGFKQFLSWLAPGLLGSTPKQTGYYESGSNGKYGGGSGGSRGIKSVHMSNNATVVACTHHEGGSEEYIMKDLEGGRPGGPIIGINKRVEVMVESEEIKDNTSQTTSDRRKNWA
ncbi:hypothetical protein Q9L58_004522 [Maublancomyces gigas]|uniref:Rhodopsin domain-containing protein n=1 Tax=Discina gigas TaxID=1032678 RepID=A0ABR3GKM9_9PEZI